MTHGCQSKIAKDKIEEEWAKSVNEEKGDLSLQQVMLIIKKSQEDELRATSTGKPVSILYQTYDHRKGKK